MPDQPGCGCFSGDSTVQTPNGTIFLRDLKLSDHVLTYIPETGLHFSEVKPVCIISKVIVKGDPSNPLTFSGLDLYFHRIRDVATPYHSKSHPIPHKVTAFNLFCTIAVILDKFSSPKSGMSRIHGTKPYKQRTNCSTKDLDP